MIYYDDHYPNGPQINGPLLRSIYAAALASGDVSVDTIGDRAEHAVTQLHPAVLIA